MNKIPPPKYTTSDIQQCIDVLEELVKNSAEMAHLSAEQRKALLKAAGYVSHPNRDEFRKRKKESRQLKQQKLTDYEKNVRAATGIRSARQASVFTAPLQIADASAQKSLELIKSRHCYVCKAHFTSQ